MSTAPSPLAQAQTTITKGVSTITSLLNLAPGPTAVAGFVAEGIFKAIQLGVSIHKAQQAANASLDLKVRCMDLVRLPVSVNLDQLELQSFYENQMNLAAFPAFKQFSSELKEYSDTGGNPSPKTLRILAAAMDLVPVLQDDPELVDHPDMAGLFGIGLDPTRASIHELVLAYVELFPQGALPYRAHYDRLGDFWKSQLTISLGEIDQAQIAAQTSLNQAIRTLVSNAILDPTSGALATGLAFAKNLKSLAVTDQITDLTAKKAKAKTDAEKAAIQADIDALTKFKTRLA